MQKYQALGREQKGFTLLEMLVSLAIIGSVVGIVFTTYLTAYRGYNRGVVISTLQEEGVRVSELLNRLVRSSVDAEYVFGNLELEIDRDSLEYQENGECDRVQVRFVPETATENGYIEKVGIGCTVVDGGILTKSVGAVNVNVSDFILSVEQNSTSQTKLVNVNFSLRQGLSAPDRSDYEDNVSFEVSVSTRGYTQ